MIEIKAFYLVVVLFLGMIMGFGFGVLAKKHIDNFFKLMEEELQDKEKADRMEGE